jgi:putative PIN family toxin of toxin-antitoxin system
MIRVVLDTNIIVSALLNPLGPPAQVFSLAVDGAVQLCVSGKVYDEYEDVIRRPRLGRSEKEISAALRVIRETGFWVKPTRAIRACTDPDDDIFLECAQAGGADYVVTGNIKDFPSSWLEIGIVTPRRFLDILSGEAEKVPL